MAKWFENIKKSHNLESVATEDHKCYAVANTSCLKAERWEQPSSNCNCMPPSLLLPDRIFSDWRPANMQRHQQCWEAATWAHHLQGQHECLLKNDIVDCCKIAMKEPPPIDETGNKDDLLLWKLQLFTRCRRHRARTLSTAVATTGT